MRKRGAVTLLAGIVLAAIAIVIAGKREPPLLTRSRPVLSLGDVGLFDYGWRSPTRLIAFTMTGSGRSGRGDFAEVDVSGGRRRPLSAANPAFGGRLAKFSGFRVSPDGRWLLAGTPSGSAAWFLALSLDSPAAVSPSRMGSWYPISDAAWLRDGSGSVRLSSDGAGLFAVVRTMRPPKAVRGPSFGFPTGTSHFDLLPNHLLGQLPGGAILYLPGDAASMALDHGTVPLLTFMPDSRAANLAEIAVHFPARPLIGWVELSPRGDRLAWLVVEWPHDAPILAWLRRFFPKTGARQPKAVPIAIDLQISDVRGRGLRTIERIARFEMKQGYVVWNPLDPRLPRKLRWLPDGNRISFVYRNSLWTVPVD